MTTKFDILDKGYVELLDTFGDELTIVNAARVSFGVEQKGVASNNVPQVITSKPVTTVNCGTVSFL